MVFAQSQSAAVADYSQVNQLHEIDGVGSKTILMDTTFKIKPVRWSQYDHECNILLQDANGPCPLIALVNTLLMAQQIETRGVNFGELQLTERQAGKSRSIERLQRLLADSEKEKGHILLGVLLDTLGGILLELFEHKLYPEYDVDRLVSSLPLLHTGLTVDPILTDITFPSDDLAAVLFDLFSLPLKHGWCLDPHQDAELTSFFQKYQTFDRVQDCFIGAPNENQAAQQYLAATQSQLTNYGLRQLDMSMAADDLAVFFRNNHFSTLYKKGPGDLYLLVTDESFNSHRNIVWQSFNSVSGKDELFFTGDFEPVFLDEAAENNTASASDDYLLMKQLQEEDDRRMARRIQKLFNKPPVKEGKPVVDKQSPKNLPETPPEKVSSTNKKKEKKKGDCIIT